MRTPFETRPQQCEEERSRFKARAARIERLSNVRLAPERRKNREISSTAAFVRENLLGSVDFDLVAERVRDQRCGRPARREAGGGLWPDGDVRDRQRRFIHVRDENSGLPRDRLRRRHSVHFVRRVAVADAHRIAVRQLQPQRMADSLDLPAENRTHRRGASGQRAQRRLHRLDETDHWRRWLSSVCICDIFQRRLSTNRVLADPLDCLRGNHIHDQRNLQPTDRRSTRIHFGKRRRAE